MNKWKEDKLINLCNKITVGHVGSMAGEYVTNGVPFLRSQNIKPYHIDYDNMMHVDRAFHEKLKKSALQVGDVAVVRTGYPGTACVIPPTIGEANCSDLVIIRPGINLNPYYLAAIFNSSFGKGLVAGNLVGAAQQHFNVTVAKELKLKFPPIGEQNKIAAILSVYDDLIENNKRRIALLEKMAEEIYREWFVRFRFPGYQTAEFDKGIPKGWSEQRFDSFCVLKRGYDLPDSQVECGSYPVIASTSIKIYHKYYKVEPPVITTGRSGSLGKVLMTWEKSWPLNTSLYVKDFKDNSPYLIYYTLKNMALENFNSGAGVPSLNRNHLASLKLSVPDKSTQKKFEQYVMPIFQQTENLAKIIGQLEKTKSSILPRLISGKLSVEDLDIQFPPSMQEDNAA